MQVISLSQNKYKQLTKLDLPREVYNTEAIIYDYRYKGNDKIFKKLFNNTGKVLANKLYTLEILDCNKKFLPDNLCIPDYLVSVGGIIEGFTMPKIEGIPLSVLLNDKKTSKHEQVYYLKQVGEILRQLEQIRKYTSFDNFYINDLHDSNFIANQNKKSLSIIDLDSCKVRDNLSCPSRFLNSKGLLNNSEKYKLANEYELGYIVSDNNSDLYCYIIMILNYLYGCNINNITLEEFYSYLNYLEHIGINKELIDMFLNIVINKDNENPSYLLDSLTENDIVRSRKIVYEANTKKVH